GNTGSLVKTHASFAGWNTETDGSGTSYAAEDTFAMGTSAVTLYAQWTSDTTYNITYHGNGSTGGSVPVDGSAYYDGDSVTVLGNTGSLVKTHASFAGWNTATDGSGTSYAAEDTFTMGTSAVTLYAQWTSDTTYNITYNGNGSTAGSVPVDGSTYYNGATVTVLGNTGSLVKTHASFAGWNTETDGSGTSYAAEDTFAMGTSAVTLYAQWTSDTTYGVTYHGNGSTGGSVPVDGSAYYNGDSVTVLGNTGSLVKTHASFAGWNTETDGSGTSYAAEDTFAMGTSAVTLYAQWTSDATYGVTYHANGATAGSVPVDGSTYYNGATVTVLGNTGSLVKTHASFAGWNTATDGSGTSYAAEDTFAMGTSAVTLYAQWTSDTTYGVTYHGNGSTGGSVPVDGSAYYNGDSVTVLGNTGSLVKTHASFAGWNTATDGSGTSYAAEDTFTMGTSDVTLYAQWTSDATDPVTPPHAAASTLTPIAGDNNQIIITVIDTLGGTDTSFTGNKTVTVIGYQKATDGSYGSFGGTTLEADGSTDSTVSFVNGVGTVNLQLNKAASQTIRFSIVGVDTLVTNSLVITPLPLTAARIEVTRDIIAPTVNSGQFAQQPMVTIKDIYGNICTNDNTTVIIVSKRDTGLWTLSGTTSETASAGVVTFTGLRAINDAGVIDAQLAFHSGQLTEAISLKVNLPAPVPSFNGNAGNADNKKNNEVIIKNQQQDNSAPATKLNDITENLKNTVFTKEELKKIATGETANVILKITDISDSVNADDKKLIEKKLTKDTSVLYIDLSLYKQIGNGTETKITETTDRISISVEIPEEIRSTHGEKDRIYQVIRIHEGTATTLEGTYDSITHLFTFQTDRFSTYVLTYKDADVDGSENIVTVVNDFYHLRLSATAAKTSQKLNYKKVSGADGYIIYGAPCGRDNKLVKLADVSGKITSYKNKNLNKATYYKYRVKAYKVINGKKVIIAISKVIHSSTTSKAYDNPAKVTVDTSVIKLAVGKSKIVTGQVVLSKGKKMKKHTVEIRYESSNKAIARVSRNGNIKAISKGTCYIYAYAQNGVYKKIKVKIK
ncbi:MAG: beta strand repeat-containing protein, partial [Velocimicrobium sp.]